MADVAGLVADETALFEYRVVDLRGFLKSLGLPTQGKKAELVQRLMHALSVRKTESPGSDDRRGTKRRADDENDTTAVSSAGAESAQTNGKRVKVTETAPASEHKQDADEEAADVNVNANADANVNTNANANVNANADADADADEEMPQSPQYDEPASSGPAGTDATAQAQEEPPPPEETTHGAPSAAPSSADAGDSVLAAIDEDEEELAEIPEDVPSAAASSSSASSSSAAASSTLPAGSSIPVATSGASTAPSSSKVQTHRANLHVDNIAGITETEFRGLFSPYGTITRIHLGKDRATGRALNYGFVVFSSDEEAANAISALNGHMLQGQQYPMRVSVARQKDAVAEAPKQSSNKLYFAGLPESWTAQNLKEFASSFGDVSDPFIMTDQTGKSRGVGFITFAERAHAVGAIEGLNNMVLPGSTTPIAVRFAREKKATPSVPANPMMNPMLNPYARMGMGMAPMMGMGGMGMGMGMGMAPMMGSAAPTPMAGMGMPPVTPQYMGSYQNQGGYGNAGNASGYSMQAMYGQPQSSAGYGGYGHGQQATGGGSGATPSPTLFIFHLPNDATEMELQQLFSAYGTVTNVNVIRDNATGRGKGYGFVTMATISDAHNAIKYLNGYGMRNKHISVDFKKPR